MTLLLRKFSKTKWQDNIDKPLTNYHADAITGCTRTAGNTLSVWVVNNNDFGSEDIKKLIAAVALTMNQPATVDFILLDEKKLKSKDINLSKTPGDTPFESINHLHKDIVDIDYNKLGIVSEHIVAQMAVEANTKRITRAKLVSIVKEYLGKNYSLAQLSEKWQKALN
ncbi:hypothetical protein [Thalassomonas sp. RHCl1]|uniref:hypothetical protein n=1 Tax=Thalassomonas sp. RHCl1 TaxID=2995320 RepID=UPI00248B7E33|nr:hypothetical protein [Thalassomonas sp. RHCl1]